MERRAHGRSLPQLLERQYGSARLVGSTCRHSRLTPSSRRLRRRRAARVPLLRRAAAPHVRRPRHVAAVRELRAGRARQRDGAVLPAAREGLRELPARAARGVRHRRGHLQRVRVLLLVLGLLGRARPRVRGDGDRALRARPGQPGHGGREQRRLPAAPRRRARHPGARHRARGERRRGGARARDRDDRALLRPRAAPPTSSPRAAAPTCSPPTT